jgi:small subunit ribosomal protein S17
MPGKIFDGVVVSDKMDKTVVVMVERLVKHPRVGKYIRRRVKLKVHEPKNDCHIGDWVRIIEARPFSKQKHWRILKILQRVK